MVDALTPSERVSMKKMILRELRDRHYLSDADFKGPSLVVAQDGQIMGTQTDGDANAWMPEDGPKVDSSAAAITMGREDEHGQTHEVTAVLEPEDMQTLLQYFESSPCRLSRDQIEQKAD